MVGIAMGSDSDLETMIHAGRKLTEFEIPHEYRILSAHRTPDRMARYGRSALRNGIKVIIAGAGGSAHLPGMLASETTLPVLGVAIESSADPMNAAFGSMVRMPSGAPLATMGKGEAGATNAALEATRILAEQDPRYREAYEEFKKQMRAKVMRADRRIQRIGGEAYLTAMREEKEKAKQKG